jgi:hypothetical protein
LIHKHIARILFKNFDRKKKTEKDGRASKFPIMQKCVSVCFHQDCSSLKRLWSRAVLHSKLAEKSMRRQNKFKIDILYHTEREKDMCVYMTRESERAGGCHCHCWLM